MLLINRVSLFAALICFAAANQAAGLRGVEVGDPCSLASDIEFRLGSKLVRSDDSVSLLHYRGTYAGQNADILYVCPNRMLEDQVITIHFNDHDNALQTVDEIKKAITKEFGVPSYDGLEVSYARKLWYALWGVSGDVMLQSAIWQAPGHEVFLWIRSDRNDSWEIRLSQSSHIGMVADAYRGLN